MITLKDVTFAYPGCEPVLEHISCSISPGSYVSIMGPSGSGKTTLAWLLKGILAPSRGTIFFNGENTCGETGRWACMRDVGLVFQNPENTMFAATVETELAFGLENLGVPRGEMIRRVAETLEKFHLSPYRHTNPNHLSGGEKQRLALASVMIMRPDCLALDEPTSLLDPSGRRMVLDYLRLLSGEGATIIHITQFPEEALEADRLILFGVRGIAGDGRPGEILDRFGGGRTVFTARTRNIAEKGAGTPPLLRFEKTGYAYEPGTPFAHTALTDISAVIPQRASTVVLGPSGSGKTTLLELAAGLARPTAGAVPVEGNPVRAMAFQLPEDQMFGEDVASYVAFGPRNLGVTGKGLETVVDEVLVSVGFDPGVFRCRDLLTLSGGEKRFAVLAGVLAMKPGLLVLDEPTAGLDQAGRERVLAILLAYLENEGTLLFSTHDFELARALADYALILVDGRLETAGKSEEVFRQSPWICSL